MLDRAAKYVPLPMLARITGRSWWAMRYYGGRVIEEPQCDWSLAPRKGRQSVRLYCPNGQVAELGNDGGDATGRLFQLKQAVVSTSRGRKTLCHIVGIVQDTSGKCMCAAWEYSSKRGRVVGKGRLVQFEDNVYNMQYGGIGRLAFDVLGLDMI